MEETIRLELPEPDADDLTRQLEENGVSHSAALSRQMTGEAIFVGIVVPVTLTAVQVIAAYLLAKRKPGEKPPAAHIEVRRRYVRTDAFSVEVVEEIIERRLIE